MKNRIKTILVSALLFLLFFSCRALDKVEDVSSLQMVISPHDYRIVSDISKEKLSCGPVSLVVDNGVMAVMYLADENSSVESYASSSIFIRGSFFNLYEDEPIRFIDVAKAKTELFGYNPGQESPYDHNMLRLDDDNVLVMFREGGIYGAYVSCVLSLSDWSISSFNYMTIDGKIMSSKNIESIYESLNKKEMVEMPQPVFITRIIRVGGYYYSHLGGYGYYGFIVRSNDGVNWETVTTPSYISGLNYILEGALGIDETTGNLFLCGRGNRMVLYRYDSVFNELGMPSFLDGATTSRPSFFNYHGELYLITNMENDISFSNGRRNTAGIFKVNGETGQLTCMKILKCKDGCSYHTVQIVGDDIWLVFQTDARHIALEDQGRSNLALYKLEI